MPWKGYAWLSWMFLGLFFKPICLVHVRLTGIMVDTRIEIDPDLFKPFVVQEGKIHRKLEAVLLSHGREKEINTAKPVWTNGSTTKPCRKARQETRKVLFRNFKPHEVKNEHCNCTRQATHLCIRASRIPTTMRQMRHHP